MAKNRGHNRSQNQTKNMNVGKTPLGEYGRVGGRTQIGALTVVDGSQEKVGIESNQDNLYTYMTLSKNKFSKRYFRKEKKNPKPKHTNKNSRTRQQQHQKFCL